MSQTDPNLVTIYSPEGVRHEMSRLNASDLSNYGWTFNGHIAAATPKAKAAPAPEPAAEPAPAPVTPPAPEAAPQAETPAAEVAETQTETTPTVRATEADFADLETKADVAAYIEATFPGTKIDGRANRDKLIALAIETAAAA